MTRIDFYFNAPSKLEVIRKLATKAFGSGHAVLLFTRDQERGLEIERYLWSSQVLSFLPHVSCRHSLAQKTAILIGDNATLLAKPDVLINLDPDVPACFSSFDRMLEVVTEDEGDREASRLRFRYFKEHGYSLIMHDLKASK